jgi:hypothetical protein
MKLYFPNKSRKNFLARIKKRIIAIKSESSKKEIVAFFKEKALKRKAFLSLVAWMESV